MALRDNLDVTLWHANSGLLRGGCVVLSERLSVEAAMDSGYGAKLRMPIIVPKHQNKCFEGEPVTAGAPSDQENGDLTLFDEEAAYLIMNRRLVLHRPDGSLCSATEIWRQFEINNIKFVARLKVYIFYRSQGYYVRGGVNFGVDFTVYRDHPTRCHSEMCVLVTPLYPLVMTETDQSMGPTVQRGMSWRSISALTRVMPDVMKLLVICYVVPHDLPIDFNSTFSFTMECMSRLTVRPVTVISRRLNNRSEDFATILNIQNKYQQLSKLVVERKAPSSNSIKKKNSKKRRAHDEERNKEYKRPKMEPKPIASDAVGGPAQSTGPSEAVATSSWLNFFSHFFSKR